MAYLRGGPARVSERMRFAMLAGALVTMAGFAASSAGEYTFFLFAVVSAIAGCYSLKLVTEVA
jgi:hypothetical protein